MEYWAKERRGNNGIVERWKDGESKGKMEEMGAFLG
jgi:hypothetical protein